MSASNRSSEKSASPLRSGLVTRPVFVMCSLPVLCTALVFVSCTTTGGNDRPPQGFVVPAAGGLVPAASEAPEVRYGTIAIENRLNEEATVYLDGREVAAIPAGGSRQVPDVAVGTVLLSARTASGREMSLSVEVFAGATHTWLLDAGRGQLVVRNLVGEAADLYVDGTMFRRMDPLSSVAIALDPGAHSIAGWVTSTQYTETHKVEVAGGEKTRLDLGPQAGRLYLENLTETTLIVYRNGRPLCSIMPGVALELAAQPLGKNLIEALDSNGAAFDRRSVEIRPAGDERAKIVYGAPLEGATATVKVSNQAGEDVRLYIDGREAGELPQGAMTVLKDLPSSGTALTAVGTESRRRQVFTVTPQTAGGARFVVTAASGGLRLTGLGGQAAVVRVDGAPATSVDAGAVEREPIHVAMTPGEHSVSVVLADGTAFATLAKVEPDLFGEWKLTGTSPVIELRNRTGRKLSVWMAGKQASSVEDGQSVTLTLPAAGVETIRAVTEDGLREWVLKEVSFPESGRFGWTLEP